MIYPYDNIVYLSHIYESLYRLKLFWTRTRKANIKLQIRTLVAGTLVSEGRKSLPEACVYICANEMYVVDRRTIKGQRVVN